MIIRSCAKPRIRPLLPKPARASFSTSIPRRDEAVPSNHYETLHVSTSATPAEIKKSFYTLSKTHHPDLHPNDPNASARFVKISEAYATLSSPSAKQKYDRTILPTTSPSPSSAAGYTPRGSYSSASTTSPAGGRPASGLSRRRTQFRGPPPSFYRSGGWGEQAEKRKEYEGKSAGGQRAEEDPGMGPGGFGWQGMDDDVPHFDREGHVRTHSGLERGRRERRRGDDGGDGDGVGGGGGALWNFVMVSGVLGVIFGISGAVVGMGRPSARKKGGMGEG